MKTTFDMRAIVSGRSASERSSKPRVCGHSGRVTKEIGACFSSRVPKNKAFPPVVEIKANSALPNKSQMNPLSRGVFPDESKDSVEL